MGEIKLFIEFVFAFSYKMGRTLRILYFFFVELHIAFNFAEQRA